MQFEDAQRLREEWGNNPCSHPTISKEYMLGTGTGDYVCTTCGRTSSDKSYFKNNKEGN